MIKKYTRNKIIVTSMALFLLLLFYFVPVNNNIETNIIEENNGVENVVYLLDNDNFVSEVISYYDKCTIEENIKKRINVLTYGEPYLNDFYTLIPKNTKLNSIKLDKDSVYLDFSKEILKVNEYLEISMIESIIYTITEINGINKIYLSVDGKSLDNLPNSNIKLDYPLTRNYGINKEYKIDNLNNINKTTIYFEKELNGYEYYVPVTKIDNSEEDKINIIIEELKSGVYSQKNLKGYMSDKLVLEEYTIDDKNMTLIFNDKLKEDDKLIDILSESIFENYDVLSVIYTCNNDCDGFEITK